MMHFAPPKLHKRRKRIKVKWPISADEQLPGLGNDATQKLA